MKEIKFRAWDGKRMLYYPPIKEDVVIDEYIIGEPLLFTGRKDKNDKEIYERDVLKIKRKDNFYGGKDIIEIVVIESPEYYELSDQSGGGPDGSYPIIEIEIMGNICENPELPTQLRENETK